jgi:hypothetical protein
VKIGDLASTPLFLWGIEISSFQNEHPVAFKATFLEMEQSNFQYRRTLYFKNLKNVYRFHKISYHYKKKAK